MSLPQKEKMTHPLAPDRPDQSFGKAFLPRRGRCGRLVSDAHGAHSACDNADVSPIPIADEVARAFEHPQANRFTWPSNPNFQSRANFASASEGVSYPCIFLSRI